MPIPYDAPAEEVRRLFGAINGAVIPGGGQNLSPHHRFYDTSALLLNLTMAANDRGDFFPVRIAHRPLACKCVVVCGHFPQLRPPLLLSICKVMASAGILCL